MKTLFLASLGCTLLALTVAGQLPSSVRWEATRDVRNGSIDKRLYRDSLLINNRTYYVLAATPGPEV